MVKKEECPECHNSYRRKHLRWNPIKKVRVCKHCDKELGRNIFYTPEVNGSKQERKFVRLTMDENEKKELWVSLTRIGVPEEEVRNRIKNLQNRLFWQQRDRMRRTYYNNEDKNKKLIEGLKQ